MGKQWKQCQTLFLGSKITADGDCSHEIKRLLLLGKKVMTNLDSIFKSRDITLPTKVHLVKAMVLPVVMYGCESWTVKKAERRRIDALELWCWRRLLRVPWTARRSNQSILKEISPRCSLEGMMLKLKLQYFGHLMRRVDSLEKLWCWEGLGAGGEGDTEDEMAGWHHWLDGYEFGWTQGVGDGQGSLACCNTWGHKELDMTVQLNWTELRQRIKQRHYFANKGPSSQNYGFFSTHVWMWELDDKESWALKNWCFWTAVLEKTLESPLDCKEIQPVHPKGNQSWIFIGRSEAEASKLWPPDVKSWLIGKDPDAGRDWGPEEKGMTKDEMVGWHHWLCRHEFE